MLRNLFLQPNMVRLKYNVSKVKLQIAFGTTINSVTREGRKTMEDSSLLVGNGISGSNTTQPDSTKTFNGILVTNREINTISSIDCCNVGGREEKCK